MAVVKNPGEDSWDAAYTDHPQQTMTVIDGGNKYLKGASKKAKTALFGRHRMGFDLRPRNDKPEDNREVP